MNKPERSQKASHSWYKVTLRILTRNAENLMALEAFYAAARTGDTAVLASALDGDASLLLRQDKGGINGLMLAAMNGHTEAVALLVDRGADMEQQDMNGFTAFIFANGKNQLPVVIQLLDFGADVNHHTRSGLFALQFSANGGNVERVRLLLAQRADVNLTNAVEGGTALAAADERGHTAVARELILSGARLQRQDNGGGNNAAFVHTVSDERRLAFAPIVRSFASSAGSALFDAILLADEAAREAEELRTTDVDRSEATLSFATHAQQLAVVLTSTLSALQLDQLLRTDAGADAFRHAVATKSILFLARPNVQSAARRLWLGELLSAITSRRIVDTSWNVQRRISGVELGAICALWCAPAALNPPTSGCPTPCLPHTPCPLPIRLAPSPYALRPPICLAAPSRAARSSLPRSSVDRDSPAASRPRSSTAPSLCPSPSSHRSSRPSSPPSSASATAGGSALRCACTRAHAHVRMHTCACTRAHAHVRSHIHAHMHIPGGALPCYPAAALGGLLRAQRGVRQIGRALRLAPGRRGPLRQRPGSGHARRAAAAHTGPAAADVRDGASGGAGGAHPAGG